MKRTPVLITSTTFILLPLLLLIAGCSSSNSGPIDNTPSGKQKANGRFSLSVTSNGSRTYAPPNQIAETKTVEATADYVFYFTDADVNVTSGVSTVSWDEQKWGGTLNYSEVHTKKYECNSRQVTDVETSTESFNNGGQPGGGTLNINPDGSYTIAAVGLYTGTPTHTTSDIVINCPANSHTFSEADAPGIRFLNYFTPFIGGAMGSMVGKRSSTEPNRINGAWHGTDQMTLFSHNLETVTLPIEVTIVWDVTISDK